MAEYEVILRKDAVNELKRFGITGVQVYLIAFIPLIEVMWADGQIQAGEVAVFEDYIERYVDRFNKEAGCQVLSFPEARAFADRFLEKQPSSELMKTLRDLVKPVCFRTENEKENENLKTSLIYACIDIAASCVTDYPYKFQERFNRAEKECLFSILETLSGPEERVTAL